MAKAPFILLVNPWITDFAAYDMWAKPLGLLLLGALLREGGCGVAMVDCLDRHDPGARLYPELLPGADRQYGTGKYSRMVIPKPDVYSVIPRRYYRYGIHPESLRARLRDIPKPDLIWVTSIMTYWYPGVQQTIKVIQEVHPDVAIWLGGIYARLCSRHAQENSGASEVITCAMSDLPATIEAALGYTLHNEQHWTSLKGTPPPALDLLPQLDYAPLITSAGCPFHCPYCASRILQPKWERRSADVIHAEIVKWSRDCGVVDFAFYDDALLLQAETTLRPALLRLCEEGLPLRFHTPNALHIRALTPAWCDLLQRSGFTTIRLGLETTSPERHQEWGGKVQSGMFQQAMQQLVAAGFSAPQVGVYLLCGLPQQSPKEVAEAIRIVGEAGALPYLAEYSPVPATPMWPQARAHSPFDIRREPLYHNNTFFACRRSDFSYQDLLQLKKLALETRQAALENSGERDAARPDFP